MADTQFSTPISIDPDGAAQPLARVPLGGTDDALNHYDEAWLQQLVFEHPSCLPVSEIDVAYGNAVPICCELNTPAGPIDVLYATPQGKLVILEAKLWRNPEARRKVVGQILDYAKEVSRWTYEDLQREVSRRTSVKGNSLYQIVASANPGLNEAQFVDEVSRSLALGRFLLLVVGDGIREGVGAIAEYLGNTATLQFAFGLVELAVYQDESNRRLVFPRILAKTAIINRSIIELRDENMVVRDDEAEQQDQERSEMEQFYLDFWSELLGEIDLDDVTQPLPSTRPQGNVWFALPPSASVAWITAFFHQSSGRVGVFMRLGKGTLGDDLFNSLLADRDSIEAELEFEPKWDATTRKISTDIRLQDLQDLKNRSVIKSYFFDTVNRYVNVFRPRMKRLLEEG